MAITSTPAGVANPVPVSSDASAALTTFGNYINSVNKPIYEETVQPIYMQELGISELMKTLGREFAVGRDTENYHFEQARRFVDGEGTIASTSPTDTGAKVITDAGHNVRDDDNVIINGEIRGQVTATTANTFTVTPKATNWGVTFSASEAVTYFVYSDEFQKASDSPSVWRVPQVDRIESTLSISKEFFKMSGSQMTDGAWVTINGKKAYIFYGEEETYKRFRAMEEMKMILDIKAENTNLSAYNGTQGLFDGIESRGNVWSGYIESLADIDDVTEALDTEAGESAYAAYVNSKQFNYLNDLVADNVGLAAYGMFQNGQDSAIKFGFKGMSRSGYDIMFHKWPVLTNPQLGGKDQVFKGVLFPLGEIKDAETGKPIPCMSILYKELGGYSRRMESFYTGAVNGTYTDSNGNDSLQAHYRSETGFRLAGANRFVLIK